MGWLGRACVPGAAAERLMSTCFSKLTQTLLSVRQPASADRVAELSANSTQSHSKKKLGHRVDRRSLTRPERSFQLRRGGVAELKGRGATAALAAEAEAAPL